MQCLNSHKCADFMTFSSSVIFALKVCEQMRGERNAKEIWEVGNSVKCEERKRQRNTLINNTIYLHRRGTTPRVHTRSIFL